jgi:hypothetical protein
VTTVLVAVDAGPDGAVAGFSQSALLGEEGEIRWIHVHPEARGRGIGAELLDRTEELLRDQGATRVEAKVLDANPDGARFYEAHGFERAGEREIEVAGETFVEAFYETLAAESEGEPARLPDGDPAYVARDEAEAGSKGEFFSVYRDPERAQRYGWLCGNCGGMEIAMDAMGRAECADCGNTRRPTRWDAAYL